MNQDKPAVASESFLNALVDAPKEVVGSLRVLKKKIFIPERALPDLLSYYQNWLAAAGVGSYSTEKLLNRIFGGEVPGLFYLPEGNDCYIGHVANLPEAQNLNIGLVPVSNSVPIGAKDYLHPKDPSIYEIKGVELKRPLNQACQIWFESKDQKFFCGETFLRKFAEIARNSKKTQERYHFLNRSLKDVLVPLRDTLAKSSMLSKSRPIFVPEVYKNSSDVVLRLAYSTVFVFKGHEIIDLFETRGRGFEHLMEKEVSYLVEKKNQKSIDVLQLLPHDKGVIGKLKIAGKWYALDKRGFRFLLENISASRWFRGKLESTYTLKNVLEAFVPALKNADWINVSNLGRQGASDQKAKPRFELKYTPWTFKTGKNYTIVEFDEGGLSERPKNK